MRKLRYRVNYFLAHPEKITLGKEKRFFALCPKDDLPPCVKKRPSFVALSFCFLPNDEKREKSELAYILDVEKAFPKRTLP